MAIETWFYVYPCLNRITEVQVDKVTDTSVVIGGRRYARASGAGYYESSLERAKAKMIDHHEILVSAAAAMLSLRERDLERAKEPQIKRIANA